MRNFKFARNLEFKVEGKEFVLKRMVGDVWQAENQKTGAYEQFSTSVLQHLFLAGKVELMDKPIFNVKVRTQEDQLIEGYLDNLEAKQREYVVGKRMFLIIYQNNYGGTKTAQMMKYALEREWESVCPGFDKPSASAALKWLDKFEKSGGDVRSLFPRFSQCGNRTRRIDDELEKICLQMINEDYMTRNRPTLKSVHDKVLTIIERENKLRPKSRHIKMPSISTMRSTLKSIPAEEVYASRYGAEAARHKYRTSIGSSYAEAPLAVYEIDHTRLDFVVVDDETGLEVDRPWLTLVIDRFSKCIAGFYIGFEPPSHETVAAALKHAILPKTLHESVSGSWPMYGIPMMIVVDNGLEFHGEALKQLCAEIGMSISFCPRKKGWAKGTVERAIGTINRRLSEMMPSGRTFHSIAERGDYKSGRNASVSLDAVRIAAEKYIVDVYHETPHRGIHCKPIQKWETFVDNENIRLPVDPGEFDAISGSIDTRKVFHYGIEINNVTYNSQELMKYRDSFKGKATVRWNKNDLGHIHVMVPNGPRLQVPVHKSANYLKGMSYYVWKIIQTNLRKAGTSIKDRLAVANMVQDIREFMSANAKKNKQTRQQHVRFRNATKHIVEKSVVEVPIPEVELVITPIATAIPVFNVSDRNQTGL